MAKKQLTDSEKKEIQAQARARASEIICSPEAEHKQSLAKHLAFDTNVSIDEALSILKKSPISSQQFEMSPLDRTMSQTEQPGISSYFNK